MRRIAVVEAGNHLLGPRMTAYMGFRPSLPYRIGLLLRRGRLCPRCPTTPEHPHRLGTIIGSILKTVIIAAAIVIVGVLLLRSHQHRVAQEKEFIATLPSSVKPCRSDRSDARLEGSDFRVICQGVTYFKAHDNAGTDAAWQEANVGGKVCLVFDLVDVVNWESAKESGTPGRGSVACVPGELRWCDLEANVVGKMPTISKHAWTRALGYTASPSNAALVYSDGSVDTVGCGNMVVEGTPEAESSYAGTPRPDAENPQSPVRVPPTPPETPQPLAHRSLPNVCRAA